jgi:hypothetical protein
MTGMSTDEASRIYRTLFGKDIPGMAKKRFDESSPVIEAGFTGTEVEAYKEIIRLNTDLAAVEYVSRITGKNQLLVKKFQVMLYFGECLPENYGRFINEKQGFIRTLLIFGTVPFNSVYKFLKGWLILRFRIK